ncbi:MAG TPA: alpha-galactosidase [Planctomycetota bacterium]|nr:alpha-galactosidase [Planctomycetota bacterium]
MKTKQTQIKIAYIGGGSRAWAHMLIRDLALCPHLSGELALYDIDRPAARGNVRTAEAIFGHPDAVTRFRTTVARTAREALRGADFVVMSIEPGPITMRYADLEMPARYGIVQPVGDSTGPGGLLRALRAIPVYADYAHQIMAVCPRAWVINYTNPMTLCTAALHAAEPKIKAFGCCHEVFGTQGRLAGLVERWFGVKRPDRREIRLDISGVNHFTFATAASWRGRDLFPRLARELSAPGAFRDRTAEARGRKRQGLWFRSDGLVAFDLFRRFGALGAAGDRHLAEFVPWYLQSEKELHRWGVVLTPYSWRVANMRQLRREKYKLPERLTPSGEEGVAQMLALLGIAPLDTNVNQPNRGQNPDLPLGAVTESYAQFRRNSVRPMRAGRLPAVLAGHMRRICDNQQAILKAAMTRDRDLAFQALLADPLVHLPTDQAWEMFGKMLRFAKPALPGWKV